MGRKAQKNDSLPGSLDMLILRTLSLRDLHGYGIVQFIQQSSDSELLVEEGSLYPALQRDQLSLELEVSRVGMVTCADCSLDDGIHVSTQDHLVLGQRLANLACHDLFPDKAGCGALKSGPRPVNARMEGHHILVEFTGVSGHLRSAGRLNGFAILDATGKVAPTIYSQRSSESNPNVVELLFGNEKLPDNLVLGYGIGFGRDMYVNLSDDAGMAAPVFGPMPTQK